MLPVADKTVQEQAKRVVKILSLSRTHYYSIRFCKTRVGIQRSNFLLNGISERSQDERIFCKSSYDYFCWPLMKITPSQCMTPRATSSHGNMLRADDFLVPHQDRTLMSKEKILVLNVFEAFFSD